MTTALAAPLTAPLQLDQAGLTLLLLLQVRQQVRQQHWRGAIPSHLRRCCCQ